MRRDGIAQVAHHQLFRAMARRTILRRCSLRFCNRWFFDGMRSAEDGGGRSGSDTVFFLAGFQEEQSQTARLAQVKARIKALTEEDGRQQLH